MPTLPQTFLETKDSFKVYARIRPFTDKQQKTQGNKEFFSHDLTSISVKTKNFQQNFNFDHIFNSESQQTQVYQLVSKDILENAFRGINGSIFCYGQTCSGKTHTIVGDYGSNTLENQGLLPRILKDIIIRKDAKIDDAKSSKLDIRIKISMIEIYNEKIFDLLDLSRKNLRLRQNKKQGVFVQNLTEQYISSVQEAMKFVFAGLENRTSGRTNENKVSSRSHMIFAISIVQTDFQKKQAKSSKITLIDLAGSQRLAKAGVQGKMLLETKKINLSLSTLGKVINALGEGSKAHIPYRDSKLTRLLKESIGGNCLTRLIINLSPSSLNETETVSSLRFGSTAKLIKNRPRINKEYTVEELLALLEKAELKIKQLSKFIEEFDKHRFSQSGFPSELIQLRDKAAQAIPFHLVDYNDEESDEKISIEEGSKVSSVHESSQYVSNDGSGVFSPFGMDTELDSPGIKRLRKKATISSCKSMKLLSFNQSPDQRNYNKHSDNKNAMGKKGKISEFLENEEEDDSYSESCRKSREIESNFNVEDLSDIFGENLNLRKNHSLKVDEKLDFSVKSIHESVNEIRQKCLKRMGLEKEEMRSSFGKGGSKMDLIRMEQMEEEQNRAEKKDFCICASFSIKVGDEVLTRREYEGKNREMESTKIGEAICSSNYQTESGLQGTKQSTLFLSEQKNSSLSETDLKLSQLRDGPVRITHTKIITRDNIEDLQFYKKIIQQQNQLISDMRKKDVARRLSLSQDIDKLKLVISQKSPRSSIITLETIQKSHFSQTKEVLPFFPKPEPNRISLLKSD